MIVLYILLSLLIFCTLLCFVKLEFIATYSDTLTLKLKVLFLKFTLVPSKKKPKKKKKSVKKTTKKQNKDDKEEEKEKKPSYFSKLYDKKGLSGIVTMVVDLAKLVSTTLKGTFTNIVIEKLDIDISVVGDDAADTALKYGKLCGVFYPAVNIICETAQCKDYSLKVRPDFDDDATMKIKGDFEFYIRVFYVVRYALSALFKLIVIRYKK